MNGSNRLIDRAQIHDLRVKGHDNLQVRRIRTQRNARGDLWTQRWCRALWAATAATRAALHVACCRLVTVCVVCCTFGVACCILHVARRTLLNLAHCLMLHAACFALHFAQVTQ